MAESGQGAADMGLFEKTALPSSEVVTPPLINEKSSLVLKLTHPPSAVPNFSGLPTNDTRTQVITNYVSVGIIKKPSLYDFAANQVRQIDQSAFSDYAILSPNGGRVLAIPFCLNATTGVNDYMDQDLSNVIVNDQYDFTKWQNDTNLFRPIYKLLTTYLNATAFNNTGIVTGSQFNPNIMFAGTVLSLAHNEPVMFYEYAKHMIKSKRAVVTRIRDEFIHVGNKSHPVTPALEHPEYSVYKQLPVYIRAELSEMFDLKDDEFINLDPNTNIQVANFNSTGPTDDGKYSSCCPTPSQIMNNSARSYTGKALDGTFSVQRLNTVAPAWQTGSNTSNGSNGYINAIFILRVVI